MKDKECHTAMRIGRKLFKQENKRFNGILKFAYVKNDKTGETVFFSPDEMTSDRIRNCLNAEFVKF